MNSFALVLQDQTTKNNLRIILEFLAEPPMPDIEAFNFPRELDQFVATIETASPEKISAIIHNLRLAYYSKIILLELDPKQAQTAFEVLGDNPKNPRIQLALIGLIAGLIVLNMILALSLLVEGIYWLNAKNANDPTASSAFTLTMISLTSLIVVFTLAGCNVCHNTLPAEAITKDPTNFRLWLEDGTTLTQRDTATQVPSHSPTRFYSRISPRI